MQSLGVDIDIGIPACQLSVAEQQMVEIAKAISWNAKLIIMDEPTAALTEREVVILFKTIKSMKENGLSVIYISHRLEEIFRVADRVTVLKDGGLVDSKPISEVRKDTLVRMMVGRELRDFYPERNGRRAEKIMEVKNLVRQNVLKNISFDVYKGEILGIAGLVGAGRIELARAIFGADRVDSGKILIGGKKVAIRRPLDAINCGIDSLQKTARAKVLYLGCQYART